jgi:hypothetical protein
MQIHTRIIYYNRHKLQQKMDKQDQTAHKVIFLLMHVIC